ncbi:MAG: tetratricopeptide repeat protein [Candidatus Omnitrophica bacterium]|nr:tetratricopeptide repeat protein [Candidatus Omnitrophota bacterium]MCF7897745.1 tetratricopeptide repeat protein [Candidatus Omnitrophota bacterium]MCF7909791.1 tetratricopeptide repeat protein [Candidatus Omnitrophota bacterium]
MKKMLIIFLSLFFINNLVFAKVASDYSSPERLFKPSTEEEKTINAIKRIEELSEEDPKSYQHYEKLSVLYNYIGQYEKELEVLKKAIKYYPKDGKDKDILYGNLARTYLILNRPDEAKQALDKATKINPKNPINQMHLVQYYMKKRELKKSASALKRLNDLVSDAEQYYKAYNHAFLEEKMNNEELIAIFRELAKIDPQNSEAHKMYATALRNDFSNINKNFPTIMKEYKKAIKLDPRNIFNYITIANTYTVKARMNKDDKYFQNALDWLKKAKNIDPDHKKLPFVFGYCYLYMGEYDKAIINLEKAVRNNPKEEEPLEILLNAYNGKAYQAYKEGKNLEEGIDIIDKALSYQPENGIFLSTKAELLYKMGRYQEAYEYIKRGIALEPDYPEIQQDLKMIEEALKDKKN